MREVKLYEALGLLNERLKDGGVFLNVGGEKPNTMTIGWGFSGPAWGTDLFAVMVRPVRHTHDLLEKAGEFTISVPTVTPLKKELAFAGTASGRDTDKFAGHGLTAAKAIKVQAPIVKECGLHIECVVKYTSAMDGEKLFGPFSDRWYPNKDFHTMFYGEVIAAYYTD